MEAANDGRGAGRRGRNIGPTHLVAFDSSSRHVHSDARWNSNTFHAAVWSELARGRRLFPDGSAISKSVRKLLTMTDRQVVADADRNGRGQVLREG